jgi:hypothetical protein
VIPRPATPKPFFDFPPAERGAVGGASAEACLATQRAICDQTAEQLALLVFRRCRRAIDGWVSDAELGYLRRYLRGAVTAMAEATVKLARFAVGPPASVNPRAWDALAQRSGPRRPGPWLTGADEAKVLAKLWMQQRRLLAAAYGAYGGTQPEIFQSTRFG